MPFVATFIVLAVLGIIDAGFLIIKHQQKDKRPLACPLNHDCSQVTESKWSTTLGVRNELLGLMYYLAMLVGALALIAFPAYAPTLYSLFLLAASASLLFSLFLTILQFTVLQDYCFYCLISAGLTLLLFVNSLALYL